MTQSQFNTFKTMLNAKHAELKYPKGKLDEIAIERAPDLLDEIQRASERELATRSLERESKLAREVRAALARVEDGSYGVCGHCDEEIGIKRLNALPWAPLCIRCQEQVDNSGFVENGHEDHVLPYAA